MSTPRFRPALAAGLLLAACVSALAAQTTLTAATGPNRWDLTGTGTGWTVGIGVERGLSGPFALEARLAWFAAPDADDDPVRALLPEAGVVLTVPAPLPLRLALGAGWSLGMGGWPDDVPTLYAGLGLDLPTTNRWSIRPEVRVRTVDPWVGTIAEFQLGLARRGEG